MTTTGSSPNPSGITLLVGSAALAAALEVAVVLEVEVEVGYTIRFNIFPISLVTDCLFDDAVGGRKDAEFRSNSCTLLLLLSPIISLLSL